MNSVQKVIKYVSMGFAALLAVGILSAIVGALVTAANALGGGSVGGKTKSASNTFEHVRSLDIDGDFYKVKVQTDPALNVSDTVRVEFKDVYGDYEAVMKGTELELTGSGWGFNWFNFIGPGSSQSDGEICVWLPEGFSAEEITLDGGAGNIEADNIKTGRLRIDAGAGNITVRRAVAEKTELDGGAGKIELSSVSLGDSKIDGGAGDINIEGALNGNAEIDGGVGSIELTLDGRAEDYHIKTDSGLGDIRVNGDGFVPGSNENARYQIDIDGGMGDIEVNFPED